MPPHFWHVAIALGSPVVIILAFKAYDRRVDRRDALGLPARTVPRDYKLVAAASFGAGLVHLGVCPEHFREATSFGVFFAVAAAAQVAWAIAVLVKPSRNLWLVGAAGNAALILLWVITRTVGLPFGPEAGEAEAIGLADVVATALEVTVIVLSLRLLSGLAARASETAASAPRGCE